MYFKEAKTLDRGNTGISTFKSAGYHSTLLHNNRKTHTPPRIWCSLSKAELLCLAFPVEAATMTLTAWSLEKLNHLKCCGENMPERRSSSFGFSTSGSNNTCWDKIRVSETSGTLSKSFKKYYFRINFQGDFKTLSCIPEPFGMMKKTSSMTILPKSSKLRTIWQQNSETELPDAKTDNVTVPESLKCVFIHINILTYEFKN